MPFRIEKHISQAPAAVIMPEEDPHEIPLKIPEESPHESPSEGDLYERAIRRVKGGFQNLPSIDDSLQSSFRGGPNRPKPFYQVALWSWTAALIDGVFLVALVCLFTLAFLFLMNLSFAGVLTLNRSEWGVVILGSYLGLAYFYMIMLRAFLGATLGEWACGLRVGTPHDQIKYVYTLRIMLRTTLIFLTGLILFPVLSLLLKKDLAGFLTGPRLMSH